MKIALTGASGFVGTRLLEQWRLGGTHEAVPVVRSYGSLAVMARFELPWAVCDILDPAALAKAFQGCDAVVHAAIGDPAQIVGMAESVYRAAEAARVRRVVVLSSASVHGQAPPEGTDENTPLHERHAMVYNTAKVRAEAALRRLSATGSVEVVLLRPSVVYGPRSRWIADAARQLLDGSACLIGDGGAICNGIYVDNLVHAIERALTVPQASGEAFLVGDAEHVTWHDFYRTLADALGVSMETVRSIEPPVFRRPLKERVGDWTALPATQKLLPFVPGKWKRLTKLLLANWQEPPAENAWTLPAERPSCAVTEEMTLLQQCRWRLPIRKARALLGYAPPVSFAEGMRRSIGWLAFAGYPVIPR
ncbi:MAG: NAD-dependent epimerase/dehydratase family protein [Chthoniobacteraceae bacterium]|nr:NAD-dependent epimerase/dehydratase family protein [Chthoniobacteraceae bacterium]